MEIFLRYRLYHDNALFTVFQTKADLYVAVLINYIAEYSSEDNITHNGCICAPY